MLFTQEELFVGTIVDRPNRFVVRVRFDGPPDRAFLGDLGAPAELQQGRAFGSIAAADEPTDTLNPLSHQVAGTMMLPTHALAGMAAALPFALAVPELGGVALLAGFIGGAIPDLDLYVGHRKSLHYPVYYPAMAVLTLALALVSPTAVTAGAAFLLLGAALHSVMDVLGGGLELYPWAATSDRAVYDHYHGRWLSPRRVIPYDGSVEDLLLAGGLGLPLVVLATGEVRWLVAIAFLVATGYTAVRRQLPDVAVWLLDRVLDDRLPDRALAMIPDRYRQGTAPAVPDAGG